MIALAWPIVALVSAFLAFELFHRYLAVLSIQSLRSPMVKELEEAVKKTLGEHAQRMTDIEGRVQKVELED